MKKTVKLCAIAVVSLSLLCSCGEAPNMGTSENYAVASAEFGDTASTENEYVGYTFEYPKDWTVLRNDGMISVRSNEQIPDERVTISCTTADCADPNLAVQPYWDGNESTPGYYQSMQEAFGGDFEEISRSETELGNTGAPALKVVYKAKIVDKTYMFGQVISIYDGSIYTFTYTALPDYFEAWEPALTHAVTSFRIK